MPTKQTIKPMKLFQVTVPATPPLGPRRTGMHARSHNKFPRPTLQKLTLIPVAPLLCIIFRQVVGRKAPTEADPKPPAYRMKLFAPNEVIARSRFWYFMHQVRPGLLAYPSPCDQLVGGSCKHRRFGGLVAWRGKRAGNLGWIRGLAGWCAARGRSPGREMQLQRVSPSPVPLFADLQYRNMKKTTGEILDVNEIREKDPYNVKNYGLWLRYDSRSGTHNMYREYRTTTLNKAIDAMYSEMAGRHRARPRSIAIIKTATIDDEQCKRPHMLQYLDKEGEAPVKFALPHRILRAPSKKRRATFIASAPQVHFN